MARRHVHRRSRRNGDDFGCLGGLFVLIILLLGALFSSDNPAVRAIAWGIVGVFAFLCILANSGVSGEDALGILGFVFLFAIGILIVIALMNSGKKEKDHPQKEGDGYSKEKERNDSEKRLNISARKDGMAHQETGESRRTIEAVSVPDNDVFEMRYQQLEAHIRKICGAEKVQIEDNIPDEVIENKGEVSNAIPASDESRDFYQEDEEMEPDEEGTYFRSVKSFLYHRKLQVNYQKIMIENMQLTDIRECPGIAWVDEEWLYVYPLRRDAECFSWPLEDNRVMRYEKRVEPDVDQEYVEIGLEPIAKEFEELFPQYLFSENGLYSGTFHLPCGLSVTNTSGSVLYRMLKAVLVVDDSTFRSSFYEKEIKELYLDMILYENKMINYEEYEARQKKLLMECRRRLNDETKYQNQIDQAKQEGILL